MRPQHSRLFSAAAALLVMLLNAPVHADSSESLEVIRACMDANRPKRTSTQTIVLRARDRTGAVSDTRANVYWQKDEKGLSRVMMRIFDPPDMRMAGLLILEQEKRSDMFLFLPELERVRRVTKHMSGGSMFGTDFSFEQFERLYDLVEDGKSERLEDDMAGDRPVYVIDSWPAPERDSSYERIRTFVDQKNCLPLRIEFYERGNRLRRLLLANRDDIIELEKVRLPRTLVAKDLRDETETELIIEKIEVDTKIPRKIFTTRWLESGRY